MLARLAVGVGATDLGPALAELPGHAEQVLAQEDIVRQWAGELTSSGRIILPVAASPAGPPGRSAQGEGSRVRYRGGYDAGGAAARRVHRPERRRFAHRRLAARSVPARAVEMSKAVEEDGLIVYSVGVGLDEIAGSRKLEVPATPELLAPFVTTIPLQMLSCFLAEARGTNPDRFRLDQETFARAMKPVKF